MSTLRTSVALGAALLAVNACRDPAPTGSGVPPDAPPPAAAPGARPDRLALLFARALASPAFRAYVKAQLDASPFPEHKIELQHFLPAASGRALRYLAEGSNTSPDDVRAELDRAIPLEVYLPVPAQRAAWPGDANVLVATALKDKDTPVAFDPSGRRYLLSADAPPSTPVMPSSPWRRTSVRLPPGSSASSPTAGAEAVGPAVGEARSHHRPACTCAGPISWETLKGYEISPPRCQSEKVGFGMG